MRSVTLILIAALIAIGWVAAGPKAMEDVPEGCREAITLLCADPAWPEAPRDGASGGTPSADPLPLRPISPPAAPVAGATGVE